MSVHVHERLLQLFEAEGIKTLFGIPDPSFVAMFIAAEARGWRVIAPHHEQAGAFVADAMWRMTGRPGIIVGDQGPGVANLAPAAICAAKENTPTIFIMGQRQRLFDQRVRRGRFQYTPQPRYFESAMKYVGIIEFPEQTDEIVHEAFRRALGGTPGPVYIEYPMSVMQAQLDLPPPLAPKDYRLVSQCAGAGAMADAVSLIAAAKQPILLLGQGAFVSRGMIAWRRWRCAGLSDHPDARRQLLPRRPGRPHLCLCLAGRHRCRGAVRSRHCGGRQIGEPIHYGIGRHWAKGNVDRKWIYVERDPLAIGVNRHIDVPLVGDLRDVVSELVEALKTNPRRPTAEFDGWIKAQAGFKAMLLEAAPTRSQPVHPARFAVEATRALPPDAVLVRDGGSVSIFTWTFSQFAPRDVMWCQNFGHLEIGLPHAIGAQLAVGNDRRVVLISGDSSFLFHISELETAVRNACRSSALSAAITPGVWRLPSTRGISVRDTPETEAHWGKQLRLDKIAEGFGAYGEFVDRAEDIGPAVKRALAAGRPAVVQVAIDELANATEVPGFDEFASWYGDAGY